MSRRADLARSCCIGLFLFGCGGGSAEPRSWPPQPLGGNPPDFGPLYDPAIDPETSRIYPDYPACDGPSRVLRERERIELNDGDYVDARRLGRWEGSPRCELEPYFSPYMLPSAVAALDHHPLTLRLDVRLADEVTACERASEGQIQAAATVWMQLRDSAGATLEEGTCTSAVASAWPAGTNLVIECFGLTLDLRAGWFELRSDPSARRLPSYFQAQCQLD